MPRASTHATPGRGQETRTRILDIAQAAVLAKGFEATSIEEIVVAAQITKGGFFYHFPDKNALARALIARHVETEDRIFDEVFARAHGLHDDPLHIALIALKLIADLLADMPQGHPGCLVATAAYQERLFDAEVRDLNRQAVLGWRRRFRALFEPIFARYPPREPVDPDRLADMVSTVVEGGIVMSRALGEPHMVVGQILLFRQFVKQAFLPPLH